MGEKSEQKPNSSIVSARNRDRRGIMGNTAITSFHFYSNENGIKFVYADGIGNAYVVCVFLFLVSK